MSEASAPSSDATSDPVADPAHELLALARGLASHLERRADLGLRRVDRSAAQAEPSISKSGASAARAESRDVLAPTPPATVPLFEEFPAAEENRKRARACAGLGELRALVASCTACGLAKTRTQTVFSDGREQARLMFIGEAPGQSEDEQGVPFVGAAGQLLTDIIRKGMGLARSEVYIANVLKCRPPGNRDPAPDEIQACEGHLFRQIELIRPRVVATLGNFATKLLSGKPTGITRVHGVEQEVTLGESRVLLYPLYHPAAALYTPAMLSVLEQDFARLPELMGKEIAPPAPLLTPVVPEPAPAATVQLGLF